MSDFPERFLLRIDYNGTHDGTWTDASLLPLPPPYDRITCAKYVRADLRDYDPTALQFITEVRDALGPDCHKLMIDELPDYIRKIAEKARSND